jgi:hypothetical protein
MLGHLVVPAAIEPFEIRRKRELLGEIKLLDAAMASLLDDLREARMESGLTWLQELTSPMKSPKFFALELGRNDLVNQRNAVLREYAALV